MVVGVITLDLQVTDSQSLKDKRQVIKSLLDGIRHKLNVSAAELGALDSWQRSVIGASCISNEQSAANTVLNHVLAMIERNPRVVVENVSVDFL